MSKNPVGCDANRICTFFPHVSRLDRQEPDVFFLFFSFFFPAQNDIDILQSPTNTPSSYIQLVNDSRARVAYISFNARLL